MRGESSQCVNLAPSPPLIFGGRLVTCVAVSGVGGFVGPTVMGYMRDVTGSFAAGLWLLAGALLVGAVLVVRLPRES